MTYEEKIPRHRMKHPDDYNGTTNLVRFYTFKNPQNAYKAYTDIAALYDTMDTTAKQYVSFSLMDDGASGSPARVIEIQAHSAVLDMASVDSIFMMAEIAIAKENDE